MINVLGTILSQVLGIGSKLIQDKDKQAEFAFKALELANQMGMKLLDTPTYKWVDALVKLAYASEQLIKGLFRPIVSAAGLVFVAYCEVKGIALSPAVEAALAAMFPGWMYSRHKSKGKEE